MGRRLSSGRNVELLPAMIDIPRVAEGLAYGGRHIVMLAVRFFVSAMQPVLPGYSRTLSSESQTIVDHSGGARLHGHLHRPSNGARQLTGD